MPAIRLVWERVRRVAAASARIVGVFFVALLGRLQWQSPGWLKWMSARIARGWRYLVAKPVRALTFVAILAAAGGALAWYLTRPTPEYVTYQVIAPGLTEYNDNGISLIKTLKVVFSEPAAPLSQIDRRVAKGIEMSPATKAGRGSG